MLERNLNVIRKAVWTWVKQNPGLEFDDLFAEACLACLEVQDQYDPERGTESTFFWRVAENRIKDMLQQTNQQQANEQTYRELPDTIQQDIYTDPLEYVLVQETWGEIQSGFSPEAQAIYNIVTQETGSFQHLLPKPKLCRGFIFRRMRELGWGQTRIYAGFREIKEVLAGGLQGKTLGEV